MASVEDNVMPIDVDSNGEEEVANSGDARKTTTVQTGACKPVADALMRDELNLDDLCGDVMRANLHDEDNSLASKNEAGSGDNVIPIDVDSNREEEVANSRDARKTTTVQTGAYKPVADALMRDELNLDDLCGDVMRANLHDEDNSPASKNEAGSAALKKQPDSQTSHETENDCQDSCRQQH
ncbi:hypothetical protein Cgig2_001185 [Carnegiea gigantea]|uniref:Uncharacterized protein n=1 Tax=Carnegiea gigantea TaxID=171969 RepID=A0A9Q1K167_9CARY|nr:hypothetical protein Cgig2_001185 [Carnegiea gigantea]